MANFNDKMNKIGITYHNFKYSMSVEQRRKPPHTLIFPASLGAEAPYDVTESTYISPPGRISACHCYDLDTGTGTGCGAK